MVDNLKSTLNGASPSRCPWAFKWADSLDRCYTQVTTSPRLRWTNGLNKQKRKLVYHLMFKERWNGWAKTGFSVYEKLDLMLILRVLMQTKKSWVGLWRRLPHLYESLKVYLISLSRTVFKLDVIRSVNILILRRIYTAWGWKVGNQFLWFCLIKYFKTWHCWF